MQKCVGVFLALILVDPGVIFWAQGPGAGSGSTKTKMFQNFVPSIGESAHLPVNQRIYKYIIPGYVFVFLVWNYCFCCYCPATYVNGF